MTRLKQIFSLLIILFVSLSINAQDNNIITHTVSKGQTLYSISKLYGTTVEDIVKLNPESAITLSVGQQLVIPGSSNDNDKKSVVKKNNDGSLMHTIQSGETLFRLSKLYGITTQEICEANPGLSTSNFRVGETICIPRTVAVKEAEMPVDEGEEIEAEDGSIKHKVKKGETIYSIAKAHGLETDDIIAANPELKKSGLKKKMVITIPAKSKQDALTGQCIMG